MNAIVQKGLEAITARTNLDSGLSVGGGRKT